LCLRFSFGLGFVFWHGQVRAEPNKEPRSLFASANANSSEGT
jgi:hypothetical protein